MLEQTLIDAVVVVGLFVLRVGVPVAILFGVAKWLETKLQPQEKSETVKRGATARIIPFVRPVSQAKPTAQADEAIDEKRASVK